MPERVWPDEVSGVRSKMTNRTKAALLAGVTLLVAGGGGAAYLGLRTPAVDTSAGKVTAYYAATAVQVGTAGSTALADGSIRTKSVLPAELPADGVRDPSQLSGRVSGLVIIPGTVVTTAMFPDPQTRIGTVVIPAGKRALALEVEAMAGVAGFVGAGDRIDVYGVVKGEGAPPSVRLVLQGVDVLKVNGAGLATPQAQPDSPNLIYLLAVTPVDAERLIYLNEFEKLYFDLVPKGEGPVKTPGTGLAGALAV